MMRKTFLTSALDMPEIMSYIYNKSWKLQFSASSSIIIIEDYYLQTFLHSLSFFVAHPGNLHYAYTRNAVLPDIIILLTKWIFCSQLSNHCFCFFYILFTFDYHCNNLCDLIHIIFFHSTCCNRWCSKSYTTCYKR